MILCIAEVLTQPELTELTASLAGAEFVDGVATAGWHARLVKQNQQLSRKTPEGARCRNLVEQALQRNVLFQLAARPKAVQPPMFNRYAEGMTFGSHVDDALMGSPPTLRSDISLTLFLSDPASYDGGELVVETTAGDQTFKLPAGAMVLYPSSTLHRVQPVTRGVRQAAVSWVQSFVRDPAQRELLFDLDTARRTLFEQHGKTREFDLISKSCANLLRLWSDA